MDTYFRNKFEARMNKPMTIEIRDQRPRKDRRSDRVPEELHLPVLLQLH
jgi:hypothetical protein